MITSLLSRVRDRIRRQAGRAARKAEVARNTKHISGPKRIVLKDEEVVVVCLLKNAEYYLEKLLSHHRALGVKHFLLIDNGSTDNTRAMAAKEADVTVYQNSLPAKFYECTLRSQIPRQVVTGGWFLFVDTDELMEFPRGKGRSIEDFTAYCNAHGFNAVIGQCLDLFSSKSLGETTDWSYERSVSEFDQYSIGSIATFDYTSTDGVDFAWFLRNNSVSNPDIKLMFGGIRGEVFGEECCLTTHRLIQNDDKIELYSHAHCSGNLRCADFAFLLRHYKFAGDFLHRELAQVQAASWGHGEDEKRISRIQGNKDFVIAGQQQQTLVDTEGLISQGFLACSQRYLDCFPMRQ